MKTFFFKFGEWGIKKSVFHTDFTKINLFLVKSAPKTILARKIVFLGETFLGSRFT
jgi:hypothetical protein